MSRAAAKARPPEAPYLGVGVGLRPAHYAEVLRRGAQGDVGVDWFEAISENYMLAGGRPLRILEQVRSRTPLVLHGVSLNIGSVDPLDSRYLDELRTLERRFEPRWLSDHLCWTGVDGQNLHDLNPLPYTQEAIDHVSRRVCQVQDALGHRIALENVSSYLSFRADEMSEWEFLGALAAQADCGILLDVNNVFVSAQNHGFDAREYLDSIDPARVFQIHLAGHQQHGSLLIDTHDQPVRDEVWELFAYTVERLGPVSTLIEWDGQLPSYERLLEETKRARAILARTASANESRAAVA
jgi:uncharacterized protein (UPF0276 family)